jgi:hypothetical protein
MPHAIGAGSLALLAFLGGAAPEFLSDEFKAQFAPYNRWIAGFILVAAGIAVVEAVRAVRAARRSPDDDPPPPTPPTTGDRSVSIGGSNSGPITTGGRNAIGNYGRTRKRSHCR